MIKGFEIGYSRTINLGNYESLRVDAKLIVSLQDGDDWVEIKKASQIELRQLLEETYKAQSKQKGAT